MCCAPAAAAAARDGWPDARASPLLPPLASPPACPQLPADVPAASRRLPALPPRARSGQPPRIGRLSCAAVRATAGQGAGHLAHLSRAIPSLQQHRAALLRSPGCEPAPLLLLLHLLCPAALRCTRPWPGLAIRLRACISFLHHPAASRLHLLPQASKCRRARTCCSCCCRWWWGSPRLWPAAPRCLEGSSSACRRASLPRSARPWTGACRRVPCPLLRSEPACV